MATSKGSRSKRARSEVVTVRLDPKLRFAADLAARKQRRTLSSFVEWAIEDALGRYSVAQDPFGSDLTALDVANSTWDVDESDRFAALALTCPELLTHDEQVLWKLVRENGWVWRGSYQDGVWTWKVRLEKLRLGELRKHWETFCQVAAGELGPEKLPRWRHERPPSTNKAKPEKIEEEEAYIEDDIPF